MTNNPVQGIDISKNMEMEWGPRLYTAYIFQIQCQIERTENWRELFLTRPFSVVAKIISPPLVWVKPAENQDN